MIYLDYRRMFGLVPSMILCLYLFPGPAYTQSGPDFTQIMNLGKVRTLQHWSPERQRSAIPRDLRVDSRGLGYLELPRGYLQPYGHKVAIEQGSSVPGSHGNPFNPKDNAAPLIFDMVPGQNEDVNLSHTFSAKVTDLESGVKSVSFTIRYPDGIHSQSFKAQPQGNNVWSLTLQGLTQGNWSWQVNAKDHAIQGGNPGASAWVDFTVDTPGAGSGEDGGTVVHSEWTRGGLVKTAVGRIFFEMPRNPQREGPWRGFVCSGTVIEDDQPGRSIILTAAHCIFDDENKAFARNVLFIPNQSETTGSRSDRNCDNDPLGCWVPSFGVVDDDWATRVFPANKRWDFGYYVVPDGGGHSGSHPALQSLDKTAGAMPISFDPPQFDDGVDGGSSDDFTHAFGYSFSVDPNFMYCAEDMTTEDVTWWLPSCDLTGGSSGGPWIQPLGTNGEGPVISLNSWGYIGLPGMGGPIMEDPATSSKCLFETAKSTPPGSIPRVDGEGGIVDPCF